MNTSSVSDTIKETSSILVIAQCTLRVSEE